MCKISDVVTQLAIVCVVCDVVLRDVYGAAYGIDALVYGVPFDWLWCGLYRLRCTVRSLVMWLRSVGLTTLSRSTLGHAAVCCSFEHCSPSCYVRLSCTGMSHYRLTAYSLHID
jgi:hypothetical protein